jgi:hypothetical protein
MFKVYLSVLLSCSIVLLSGCLNMPTKASEIAGIPVSGAAYKGWDCDQLLLEFDHLKRREGTLVSAQGQRHKTSKTQAFWHGFGQGDGIEASELARVRGELTALEKMINQLGCR